MGDYQFNPFMGSPKMREIEITGPYFHPVLIIIGESVGKILIIVHQNMNSGEIIVKIEGGGESIKNFFRHISNPFRGVLRVPIEIDVEMICGDLTLGLNCGWQHHQR